MRVFKVGAVVVMTVAVYYMMHLRRVKQQEMMQEVETGKITYRENEVETSMQEAEQHFEEAGKALDSGDLMASFNAYHKGRGKVSIYVSQHGDQTVEGSGTIAQWYDKQITPYLAAVEAAYPAMLDKLDHGLVDPGEVKDLANFFDSDGFPRLKEMYEKKLPAIKKSRTRQASGWLRLHVYGGDREFLDLARKIVLERIGEIGGKKVVIGYSMSPEEKQATWKSLSVSINVENARYQFSGKNSNAYQFPQPDILKSAKAEFKIEGSREVTTNWDKHQPIHAEIDVPNSILLRKGNDGEAQAKRIANEHREELLVAFDGALKDLSELKFFPGIDLDTAEMVKDGQLDRQVVMAMAFADRERVFADLSELATAGVESSHGDVAWLAVALSMEELSGFVAEKLPGLGSKEKNEVLRELEKQPHYGDFEPLLATINNVPPRQSPPSQAVQALGRNLDEEKVKRAFLDKVKDSSSPGRENYLYALSRNLSEEELKGLVSEWAIDKDDDFARQAWAQLRNRDKGLADELMDKLFVKVSPAVKQTMLQGFHYSEGRHSPDTLLIIKQAASQNKDSNLKQIARSILVSSAYVPEIWDFLNDYVQSESDAQLREQIKGQLIYNLRRAHPDEADEILMKWLGDESGQVRFSVVMALLEKDDDKKTKLQVLSDKLKAGQDADILRGAVQAAYQYWKLRKGWDAEHLYEPLSEILKLGALSSDAKVQQKTQTIISRAIEAGDARYGEL